MGDSSAAFEFIQLYQEKSDSGTPEETAQTPESSQSSQPTSSASSYHPSPNIEVSKAKDDIIDLNLCLIKKKRD